MRANNPLTTLSDLLKQATLRFRELDSPQLDAEVLLAHVLGQARSYLYTWPDRAIKEDNIIIFHGLMDRRSRGEPVAYLTGHREFWSMDLLVNQDTLVPRPETETLVELALEQIPASATFQLADLGTGSGAIALAISKERPACDIIATDRSAAALKIAQQNARRTNTKQIHFIAGNWCLPLGDERFDLIVSNPPYIANNDPHLQNAGVQFEPTAALESGKDGLDDIRQLIPQARKALKKGGCLLLEHGYDQGSAVCDLLTTNGYCKISDHTDNAGIPRVSVGHTPL